MGNLSLLLKDKEDGGKKVVVCIVSNGRKIARSNTHMQDNTMLLGVEREVTSADSTSTVGSVWRKQFESARLEVDSG